MHVLGDALSNGVGITGKSVISTDFHNLVKEKGKHGCLETKSERNSEPQKAVCMSIQYLTCEGCKPASLAPNAMCFGYIVFLLLLMSSVGPDHFLPGKKGRCMCFHIIGQEAKAQRLFSVVVTSRDILSPFYYVTTLEEICLL